MLGILGLGAIFVQLNEVIDFPENLLILKISITYITIKFSTATRVAIGVYISAVFSGVSIETINE